MSSVWGLLFLFGVGLCSTILFRTFRSVYNVLRENRKSLIPIVMVVVLLAIPIPPDVSLFFVFLSGFIAAFILREELLESRLLVAFLAGYGGTVIFMLLFLLALFTASATEYLGETLIFIRLLETIMGPEAVAATIGFTLVIVAFTLLISGFVMGIISTIGGLTCCIAMPIVKAGLRSRERLKILESVILAIKNKDKKAKQRALRSLDKIGKWAVGPLINALKDEDSEVREWAAFTLGRIKASRAVKPLINALKDEDSQVRGAAAYALGEIGDPRAVEPLINALKDRDTNFRWNVVGALKKIGDPAVIPLIRALKSETGRVRWGAAYALGEIGDPRAVEPLEEALGDKYKYVREAVEKALQKIKWKQRKK